MFDYFLTFKYPSKNNVNNVNIIDDKNGFINGLLKTVLVNGTIPKQTNEQNVENALTIPDDSSSSSIPLFFDSNKYAHIFLSLINKLVNVSNS